MAPRTPRRSQTAEPFVTLSLPKGRVISSAPGPAKKPGVVDESPSTPVKLDKKLSIKATPPNPLSQAKREIATKPTISSSGPNTPSQPTSSASTPVKRRVLTLKYRTSSIFLSDSNDSGTNAAKPVDRKSRHPIYVTPKEKRNSLDGQTERRSSTASLTDTGTRSSGRTRKLTSKAQALAGTKFLPSLQNTLDVENAPDRDDEVKAPTAEQDTDERAEYNANLLKHERIEEKVSEATEETIAEVPELVIVETPKEVNDTTMEATVMDVADKDSIEAIAEPPVESLEPAAIRISARERKPTARAVELGSTRMSRKRPSSPLSVERVSKMAKQSPSISGRPSKLRHSSVNTEDASIPETAMQIAESKNASDVDESTPMNQPDHDLSELSVEQNMSSTQDSNILPEPPQLEHNLLQSVESKEEAPKCDLGCLSSPTRLFAFAKLASEWPDSDSDNDNIDGDDLDLDLTTTSSGESGTLLEKLRQQYCRCQQKPITFDTLATRNGTSSQPIIVRDDTPVGLQHQLANGVQKVQPQVPKKRRPMGTKPDDLKQPHGRPAPKSQQSASQMPLIKRSSSSFEQRMQADYLASSPKKQKLNKPARMNHTGEQDTTHGASFSSATPASRSLRVRQSDGLITNGLSAESENIGGVTDKSSAGIISSANRQNHVIAAPKTGDLTTSTKVPCIQHHTTGTSSSPPMLGLHVEPTSQKVVDKPMAKTGKVSVRGGGKSSSGGSVRLSLLDGSGKDKGQNIKQYQPIAPPQAKSIKLRFTTGTK